MQADSSLSTTRGGRSASAFPGSPHTDPSSSAMTAIPPGGNTLGSLDGRQGTREFAGDHGIDASDASGTTTAYSGTGTTLRAMQHKDVNWSDAGSTAPTPGAYADMHGRSATAGVGADSAAVSAVVSAASGESGSGWSRGVAAQQLGGPEAVDSSHGATHGTVLSALSFGDTTQMRTFIDATRTGAPPMRELEVRPTARAWTWGCASGRRVVWGWGLATALCAPAAQATSSHDSGHSASSAWRTWSGRDDISRLCGTFSPRCCLRSWVP